VAYLVNNFNYKEQQLHVEQLPVKKLAEQVKTPFYCYSQSSIEQAYQNYADNLTELDTLICYAVKANTNQAIIRTLAKLGAGADVVSAGELKRALLAGVPANKIVYSGVAKTENEIAFALEQNIFQFNLESENELQRVSKIASQLNKKAHIAFRINPDVDAKTHAKISTGMSENKFGIPISRARAIYATAASLPGIKIQGVDVHIGSQLTCLEPFDNAFRLIKELVVELRDDGHDIKIIDLGGGLGVKYKAGEMSDSAITEYCENVTCLFKDMNCTLVFEPGRSLVAESGILVSSVVYKKRGEKRIFLIIDAAMNDFIRPSMYDAYHDILAISKTTKTEIYDVVGPVCESGDTFATQREMQAVNEGDLVAISMVGAYGAVMSSSYNTRLTAPEVLVKGNQFSVIKERPSYDDLIGLDKIPSWQE